MAIPPQDTTKNLANASDLLGSSGVISHFENLFQHPSKTSVATNDTHYSQTLPPPAQAFQGKLTLTNGSSALQSIHYTYDVLGNPLTKTDAILKLEDDYQYDDLNRLTQNITQEIFQGSALTKTPSASIRVYHYDELGNITSKSDVGHYRYGENGAGPHAVTSISGDENNQFTYDANGNQTQAVMDTPQGRITRSISYTSFDVPKQIAQTNDQTASSATVNFYYNADRKRFMREDQSTTTDPSTHQSITSKTTTLYLDGMEINTTTDNAGAIHTTTKNYIGDAEKITDENNQSHVYTLLKDNIGSTTAIADETGNITQRFHYDPFGEQDLVVDPASMPSLRGAIVTSDVKSSKQTKKNFANASVSKSDWATVRDSNDKTKITRYGFTGQEEVQTGGIDLIHMNGRMYDAHLGRFLSADPIIQEPSNSQSLNRYTYCLNDPLALTDPTGFHWWNHIGHAVKSIFESTFHGLSQAMSFGLKNRKIAAIAEIVVAAVAIGAFGPGPVAFAVSSAYNGYVTYVQTGSSRAAFQTAAITFASESIWYGVGSGLDAEQANVAERVVVHGVVGGAINSAEGGDFKDGFIAAATSEAAAGEISRIKNIGPGQVDIMARGIAAGVVGGTAAAATGGNFENGMMTSAFAQMFNDELHKPEAPTETTSEKLQNNLQAASGYGVMKNANSIYQNALEHGDIEFEFSMGYGPAINASLAIDQDGYDISVGYGHGRGIDLSASANYQFRNINSSGFNVMTYASAGSFYGAQGGVVIIPGRGVTPFVGVGLNAGVFVGSVGRYTWHNKWSN